MSTDKFPLLLVPYLFAILILVWISGFIFQRRSQFKEARSLLFLSFGVILWIAAYVLAKISEHAQIRDFWYQWMRVGIVFSSFNILLFSLRHSRRDQNFEKWRLILTISASVMILLILMQMLRKTMFETGGIHNPEEMGLVGAFVLVYGFGLSIGAVIILGKAYFETPSPLRWQGAALIIGILLPVVISFQTDIMGIEWIPDFDESTFSLVFTVLIFAWIIFRQQIFNLWPVAYETILHNIHDGVIILNLDGQVMMVNPAGEAVLGLANKDVLGKHFQELAVQLGLGETATQGIQEKLVEFSPPGNTQITYQMKTTTLYNRNGENNGSVVLIYDISEWKRSQKQLTDMATIDFLTGIYNRQHFIHLAQQELLRCTNNCKPCSMILMDVDHFKSVNDQYGHQVGDQVLKQIVDLCRNNIRQVDILGRYGGEEFIILLPEIDLGDVLLIAERVRSAVNQSVYLTPQADISVSTSLGVAMANPKILPTLDCLLGQADQALYVSKNEGRNRVSVYSV